MDVHVVGWFVGVVCGWMGGVWGGVWGEQVGDGWLMLSLHVQITCKVTDSRMYMYM